VYVSACEEEHVDKSLYT